MRVLIGHYLLESEEVPEEKVSEYKSRIGQEGWEIDRNIYLWRSKGLVRIYESNWERRTLDIVRAIVIELRPYNRDMLNVHFPDRAIDAPDQIMSISGYHSRIPHNISKVKEICGVLDGLGVGYLVNPDKFPLTENMELCSEHIRRIVSGDIQKLRLF
jgi:hypothetical protein